MGISRGQALDCFRSDDLLGIGMEADAVRQRLHPEGVVTYAVECEIDCMAAAAEGEAGRQRVLEQAGAAVDVGATCIALCGAGSRLAWLTGLLAEMRQRFPGLLARGLEAPDVPRLGRDAGLSDGDAVLRLRDAGLDSILGGGMDLAGAGSARSCSREDWIGIHRAAHRAGMRTASEMIFGAGETAEQRVDFLQAVRRLQEETGGFAAFGLRGFRGAGRELDGVTAVESLRTLAISRMVLDNVEHMQVDGLGESLKVRQTALRFGGNDAGAVEAGRGGAEEDLRRIIRDAGFRPVERDAVYRTVFLS